VIRHPTLLLGSLTAIAWPLVCSAKAQTQDTEVRRIMFNYAQCVVKNHHDKAKEMILSDSDNNIIEHQYSSLIDSECLRAVASGVDMTFGGDLYRYALADALVNADLRTREDKDFSDRLPLAHLAGPSSSDLSMELAATNSKKKRDEILKRFDKAVANAWLSRFGECVVRQNPVESKYWILTTPDSAEETSRINALRPTFNQCLSNGSLTFNRTVLRGTVALNYYRLAFATKQPSAGNVH
jgi:hypothetical protein